MTTIARDEHDWFRHRLADHLLDLVDEAESARLHAHAATCAACAALLAAATRERPDGWLGAGHPSPEALVRWHQEPGALDAVETQAIEEHVKSCESCRVDLAELGGVHIVREPVADAVVREPRPRALRPRDAWLAAAGGALATAAAFLVLRWPATESPSTTPEPRAPVVAPLAPAPTPAFVALADPVRLQSPARGLGASATVVLTEPRRVVPLVLPTLFVSEATTLTIELLTETGDVRSNAEVSAGQAQRAGVLLDARALAPGPYVLRVRWSGATGAEERRYPIVFARE